MTRRVALITGGMGGIGTAVCRKLAKANGNVVVANCLPGYPQKDAWLAAMKREGYDNVHAAEGDVSRFRLDLGHGEESRVGDRAGRHPGQQTPGSCATTC